MSRPTLLLTLTLALGACRTAPVAPLPDPLPETLEWARSAAPTRAFLGLEVRENAGTSLEALSFEEGARVTAVAPGSPAAEVGVQVGDVLLRFDGVRVDDPSTLEGLLEQIEEVGAVTLEVRRGDSVFDVPVELRALEDGAPTDAPTLAWRADPARSRAGWRAGHGGVVLVTQDPGGPFARAGLEVGTVVTAVDGEPVRSERGLIRQLQAKGPGARVEVAYRTESSSGERTAGQCTVTLFEPPRRVIEATVPVLLGYRAAADGSQASSYLLDLWVISLFRYRREGEERHYKVLRFFTWSTGVGELAEVGG